MTDTNLPDNAMAFARQLGDAARQAIAPFFRSTYELNGKDTADGGFDPVTQADRAAEAAMRALIEIHRPEDGIFGEEFGKKNSQNGCRNLPRKPRYRYRSVYY